MYNLTVARCSRIFPGILEVMAADQLLSIKETFWNTIKSVSNRQAIPIMIHQDQQLKRTCNYVGGMVSTSTLTQDTSTTAEWRDPSPIGNSWRPAFSWFHLWSGENLPTLDGKANELDKYCMGPCPSNFSTSRLLFARAASLVVVGRV